MPNSVLPGDKVAIIEEYGSGNNTYDDGEIIRSVVAGEYDIDKKERMVSVKNLKSTSVPKLDDIVIGTVEAVMGSMFVVLVKYINSKPVKSQVECICSTSSIRKKNIALVNDLSLIHI